jgi:hypothetical protein
VPLKVDYERETITCELLFLRRPLAIAVIVPAVLFGQSFTAAIRGVITDTSQAAVPGARVVVKDVDLEDRFGHRGDRTLPGAHRVLQQESEGAEESLSGCQARMLSPNPSVTEAGE